ncbi:MAG: hypothetical protein AAF192_12395 [Pseudomonadota bacterium]
MSETEDKTAKRPDRLAQIAGAVFGLFGGGYAATQAVAENDNSVFGAAVIFVLLFVFLGFLGWKFVESMRSFLSGDLFDDWEKVARRQGAMDRERKAAADAKRAEAKAARDAAAKAPAAAPAPKPAAAAPAPEAASAPDVPGDGGDDGGAQDYDKDGVVEGKDEGVRPDALTEARAGGADDLKKIKGVGPKLEGVLNGLGFYHFDQIAAWTADEVAWVDVNLEGFRGRVSRDGWVEQAKLLATGGETEFSKRVDGGDVY